MEDKITEYFSYGAETGVVEWKKSYMRGKVGSPAGWVNQAKKPHIRIMFFGKRLYIHRIAWFLYYGKFPIGSVDHKNGDKTDNRICNLREATFCENSQNMILPQKNNTSGARGVFLNKNTGKWVAQIKTNWKKKYLGSFLTIEDAKAAYLKAKTEMHPSFRSGVGSAAM